MSISGDIDFSTTWNLFTSNGNEEAFSTIYHGHYNMLYYVGLKYTTDIQVIEDAIQNLFVNLLKNRTRLNPVINVRGFLIKSFRRQLFLDLKKQKKLSLFGQITEAPFDYFYGTEDNLADKDESDELQGALKQSLLNLSDRQKEIIYFRYDCDLSYEEISGILGISVESCYQSVYRSVKTLKADIEKMLPKSKNLILWIMFHFKGKRL
jgi:RNA polymerase sigma factor (sigma-70 family)